MTQVSVLLRERRIATVQSLSYSDLYTLHSNDFYSIMRRYPQKLFMMRWVALRRKLKSEALVRRSVQGDEVIRNPKPETRNPKPHFLNPKFY